MIVEKDVENEYRAGISRVRPDAVWTSPFGTDGVAVWPTVRLLLEAKFSANQRLGCGGVSTQAPMARSVPHRMGCIKKCTQSPI